MTARAASARTRYTAAPSLASRTRTGVVIVRPWIRCRPMGPVHQVEVPTSRACPTVGWLCRQGASGGGSGAGPRLQQRHERGGVVGPVVAACLAVAALAHLDPLLEILPQPQHGPGRRLRVAERHDPSAPHLV